MIFALMAIALTADETTVTPYASSPVDEHRVWVAGTDAWGHDICDKRPWLALVDFASGETRVAALPRGRTDSYYGQNPTHETPDGLGVVAAAGPIVAAAGEAHCEVSFDPFVLISRDWGNTFKRYTLPVGTAYSSQAAGVAIRGSKVIVRVEVERTSNDEPAPQCFEIGARVKATRCPRFDLEQPLDARVHKLHLAPR